MGQMKPHSKANGLKGQTPPAHLEGPSPSSQSARRPGSPRTDARSQGHNAGASPPRSVGLSQVPLPPLAGHSLGAHPPAGSAAPPPGQRGSPSRSRSLQRPGWLAGAPGLPAASPPPGGSAPAHAGRVSPRWARECQGWEGEGGREWRWG